MFESQGSFLNCVFPFFLEGFVHLWSLDFLFTVSTVEIFVKRDAVITAFILVGGLQSFPETSLDPSYYYFPPV